MGLNLINVIIIFIESNLFIGFVTLLTGLVAFYVYKKQKADSKRDIANIILLEMQNAERILSQVADDVRAGNLPNRILLPTQSWSDNKYLFVRDFDRDEWDKITDFYNYCRQYDEAVTYNNSMFQKNEAQIRVSMINIPASFLKDYVLKNPVIDDEVELEQIFDKAKRFQELLLSRADLLLYSPNKPLNDSKKAFEEINRNITQSTIGQKLKKLAEA